MAPGMLAGPVMPCAVMHALTTPQRNVRRSTHILHPLTHGRSHPNSMSARPHGSKREGQRKKSARGQCVRGKGGTPSRPPTPAAARWPLLQPPPRPPTHTPPPTPPTHPPTTTTTTTTTTTHPPPHPTPTNSMAQLPSCALSAPLYCPPPRNAEQTASSVGECHTCRHAQLLLVGAHNVLPRSIPHTPRKVGGHCKAGSRRGSRAR